MGANRLKFLMIVFRLKLFSWQPTAIASLLPCLNSSNEWVQQLRKFAIASSPQLKLETLEQQREVMRIAYRMGRGSTSQILAMEDKRDRSAPRSARPRSAAFGRSLFPTPIIHQHHQS